MQKLVSDLEGAELDYWVGKIYFDNIQIVGETCFVDPIGDKSNNGWGVFNPSTNPQLAEPITERDKISRKWTGEEWIAFVGADRFYQYGETSLIAAMRCKVASVYGEYVDE